MYIMVLVDGTTFTRLHGCEVMRVPDDFEDDTIPDDAEHVAVFREDGDTWIVQPIKSFDSVETTATRKTTES